MHNSRLVALFVPIVAALLIGTVPTADGKDTDVYLKAPTSISRDDSPNVLIILDNSGSMETNNITTFDPYNPTQTYTGAYDNNFVYWSTTKSLPSASIGTSTTSGKFPVSNNMCTASLTNLGNSAGATGYFTGYNVVGWVWLYKSSTGTSSLKGTWTNLVSGDNPNNPDGAAKMKDVECSADSPADATAGTYLASGSPINYSGRYTNNASQKLGLTGFSKPTLYSGNYLNYRANPPNLRTATRMQIAKEAVKTIIDANTNVRFGLMVFNSNNPTTPHGGRVIAKIDTMDDARRTAMKALVDQVSGWKDSSPPLDTDNANKNFTPLSETLWEGYRYLGGKGVTYGNPTPTQTPDRDLCAQDATNCTETGTYVSPFNIECQKAYVIIVTDGDPYGDGDADANIEALDGIATANSNNNLLDELASWMNTHDTYTDLNGKQTVVTYTVGFGTGITADGLALLQSTAAMGGGKYYPANDANELASAMQGAIIDALQVTTSFVAPALSVNAFNTLFNRDDVYFAMFRPSTDMRWNGNIKKYSLCKTSSCIFGEIIDANGTPAVDATTLRIKDTAKSYWSSVADGNEVIKGGAGEHIATHTSRKVYTYTGGFETDGITPAGGAPVDLTGAAHEVAGSNTALTEAMLAAASATERTSIIQWIRGQDVEDRDADGNTTEDRDWRFYDPIHSRPVIVNYGGTSTDPIMKIFVGTNDGMLHMINERTGAEEWAFVPPELLPSQKDLIVNSTGEHPWGMDNTPAFDVVDRSKDLSNNVVDLPDGIIDPSIGDYVHMYIAMRRGGRNIYAFDVTPTTKLTSATTTGGVQPKLHWRIRGGTSTGYAALGQTWSRPVVRTIRSGTGTGTGTTAESATRKVLFFGGGYDTVNDLNIPAPTTTLGNAIYIADPDTGERIWWASSDTSANLVLSRMEYSIASDLALMDSNGDTAVDRIYVGDVGGQIWRIDLSPTLRMNTNGGSSGYVFADLACTNGTRPSCTGTSNQDRRRFFYPPDVAQVNDSIYSDTPKYDIVTIASGDREDPLDFLTLGLTPPEGPVHNRIYALRDENINAISTGGSVTYPATIKEPDLLNVTTNQLQDATSTDIVSSGILAKSGWYIDLIDSSSSWVGEKSLARTGIFGGTLYVTTFTPASSSTALQTCAANEGLGQVYALNILNGGASVDLTGNGGALTTADRKTNVGGGIPSEHVVVIREGGNSDLVGTAAPGAVKKGLQRAKTYWFQ